MVADPDRPLSSTHLVDLRELTRLDAIGNRAVLSLPPSRVSVPALFAAQVARAPEATAVVCGDRSLTYLELDSASNRLAHLLAGHGARPGESVALLFSRSVDAIVAIVAVLKTGAAYLPIDPDFPAARIDFMLADTAPVVGVTTAGHTDRIDGHGLVVIDIAAVDDTAAHSTLTAPAADDIAHIIYTSGTTGIPKGVAVTHYNITRLFDAPNVGLDLGAQSGVVAVPLAGIRLLGVGNLGCTAARREVGGGARVGRAITGGAALLADRRAGDRIEPNSVSGPDAVAAASRGGRTGHRG